MFGSDRRVHKQLLDTINRLGTEETTVPGEEGTGAAAGGPLLLLTHRPRYPRERWFFKKLCSTWYGCPPFHTTPHARVRDDESKRLRRL